MATMVSPLHSTSKGSGNPGACSRVLRLGWSKLTVILAPLAKGPGQGCFPAGGVCRDAGSVDLHCFRRDPIRQSNPHPLLLQHLQPQPACLRHLRTDPEPGGVGAEQEVHPDSRFLPSPRLPDRLRPETEAPRPQIGIVGVVGVGQREGERAPGTFPDSAIGVIPGVGQRGLRDPVGGHHLGGQQAVANDPLGVLEILGAPAAAQEQGGFHEVTGVVGFPASRLVGSALLGPTPGRSASAAGRRHKADGPFSGSAAHP